ncbi:hypothetical protein M409DRAFT_15689 [Zasmidium cellare ATCC 36951]|uniref:DNA polymerase V n=1 Tax=Zasmidium cellare ATCC 36951 TaxID=1080233 RepID=A0A6A6D2J0_ZASCE|nr:uncharacterized protein M409DRAFT_15689 [Zasmidium cellare ATCC 36951]KAF2173405.1 hypothetical protein M409DRAFT_15689 [Zasmidium cellare ATCC 36951]
MATGKKRPAPQDEDVEVAIHPSRKRRVENGQSQAELAKIIDNLRDEVPQVRIEATKALIKTLSAKSDDRSQNLDYSLNRLIKGVCSGAKAARPGFSIALAEVLRLGFTASEWKLPGIVDRIIASTNPDSKAHSDEKRNDLIGRRFAFQSVLQSGVLANASDNDARYLFDAVTELASQKEWLRGECGAMLYEFLKSKEGSQLKDETVRNLINSWLDKGLLKSPEGVVLWLTIKKAFPDVKLPKGQWHHNDPLSSQERSTLGKILQKNAVEAGEETNGAAKKQSGARQVKPSFVWDVILGYLYKEGENKFSQFWDECVATSVFSTASSTERKALGLQIFTKAIGTAPAELLQYVVHPNIVRCILDQRAKGDRALFEAAKVPLNQMVNRGRNDDGSDAAQAIVSKLLTILPPNVDKLTRSTVESLLAAIDEDDDLANTAVGVISLMRTPGLEDTAEAEKKRRMLADVLLTIIRARRGEPEQFFDGPESTQLAEWLSELLKGLTNLGYSTSGAKTIPSLTATSQSLFRDRLMSCLGHLVDLPLNRALLAPTFVVETLREAEKSLLDKLSDEALAVLKDARKNLKDATKKSTSTTSGTATYMQAFRLLLALGMLQVYKQEPDSIGVLEDINACYHSPKEAGDASEMLVELLLSFVSKQSALFRKLAEQVFAAFASEVTEDGLQSMIDILSQKESLAGQQELFDQNDEDEADGGAEESDEEDGEDDEEEEIDVEDMSDVELVNGEVVEKEDDDDDDDLNSDEDSEGGEGDEDEEAAFDRKLADALGTAGMDSDEDEDGSDMDDEQMMALEPHLTNIFKERQKGSSKKQDNKDAKENIVNFKNRVLDLLTVFVKSQYAKDITLNLLHPLVTLTRTTSNQATAKKALGVLEQYFDTCKRFKTGPKLDSASLHFTLLDAIHEEMRQGGSKIHAGACSRSSQFLAKLLVAKDEKHWEAVAGRYVKLQAEWRRDGEKSKIHPSVFNEWHSWSMQR